MPHCLPVAVNTLHFIRFGGSYPVLETERHYRRALRFKGHLAPLCYCEGIHAIVALERRHCTFERQFEALTASADPDHWLPGLEFLRLANGAVGQPRSYSVYHSYARLASPHLLEAALVPIHGLTLLMTGVPQNGLPPRTLQLSVRQGDTNILGPFRHTVRPSVAYTEADAELVKTQQLCKGSTERAKKRLLHWAGSISAQEYPQIHALVSSLVRDDPGVEELGRRITQLREQLCDAPAVQETGLEDRIESQLRLWRSSGFGLPRTPSVSKGKTWVGGDIDERLEDVHAARGPARF